MLYQHDRDAIHLLASGAGRYPYAQPTLKCAILLEDIQIGSQRLKRRFITEESCHRNQETALKDIDLARVFTEIRDVVFGVIESQCNDPSHELTLKGWALVAREVDASFALNQRNNFLEWRRVSSVDHAVASTSIRAKLIGRDLTEIFSNLLRA